MNLSLYQLKKTMLRPRTAWRRRRETSTDFGARVMMEGHYFRTPLYDFFAAVGGNPDLMVDFDLPTNGVAVDIGAYTGEWAVPLRARHSGLLIHAFEPAPDALDKLRAALGEDSLVSIHPIGLAAGDFTASLAMDGPGSSIYSDHGHYGSSTVDIRDVISTFDELGIEHIDLIKINIEGAEYDLLDRLLDEGRVDAIDKFLIQFHEWHPWAYWRRHKIRRRLRTTHTQVWNHDFMWEYWERRT